MLFYFYLKNSKKIKKMFKIQKYIFLRSTVFFHKKQTHYVNTGQTMSTGGKK
jgi:hypothetical protein